MTYAYSAEIEKLCFTVTQIVPTKIHCVLFHCTIGHKSKGPVLNSVQCLWLVFVCV